MSHTHEAAYRSSLNETVCVCVCVTSYPADVQHISDDAVSGVGGRFLPGDLQSAGGKGRGPEPLRGRREVLDLGHGQTSAGLVGPGAVLCDALVDGLVL